MRPVPLVFGDNALVIRRKEPLHPNLEIGKASPMFPVPLGHLLWSDKWLRHTTDIIKAIRGHSFQKLLHVVGAFGLDVLAKDSETFLWYAHLSYLPIASSKSFVIHAPLLTLRVLDA